MQGCDSEGADDDRSHPPRGTSHGTSGNDTRKAGGQRGPSNDGSTGSSRAKGAGAIRTIAGPGSNGPASE